MLLHESYGRITVGDIAARATVNRATFYLHFRDKDALLDHWLESMTREALEQSAPLGAAPRSLPARQMRIEPARTVRSAR